MTEPKRMQLTTVAPKTVDKSAKNTTVTVRLDLTLVDSTDTSCPEFFYSDLVKKVLGPEKGDDKPNHSSDDPFGDEDAEQKQVAALAKKFEEKYGPKPGSKKKKRLGRIQDLVDLGDGYDVEDPFIDNSEAYDEVVPGSLMTRHGGFYINSGKLDFKEIKDDSDDDFVITKKKGKKRTITSDSESDGEEKAKKKIKLKEGALGEKKKKKLLNSDGEKVFKKPKKPLDKEKLAKKKKTSPTVSELLKQQSQSTSAPVSHTNGSVMDLDVASPSTNDSGSSQDAKSYEDRIDSIIDSVIAMNSGDQKNLDSIILDSTIGLDKDDSNGKDDMKSLDPASIPALPTNMTKELELTIKFLKEKAKNSRDGKCKFFTNEVNDKLLVVEVESKKLGSCGQRSKIYNHLAAFLPCSKDTLLKRAKKLHQSRQDDELKEPVQKLRNAINGMMPALQEKYEAECQRQALLKQDDGNKDGNKEEAPKGNDTEDSEDEKSQSNNDTSKKGPKGVRKKFEWTESIRSLLCQIVGIKMKSFDIVKKGNQTAEEFVKQFLDRDIRPLWPKGWMQTRTLFKESRAAHSVWTAPQKPKKIGNVLMSKSTPNNSTNTTPSATNNNIPKFTPGSTPARPSTYEELTREMAQKSQSTTGIKPMAAKSVPTILDYASKDDGSEMNKTNNSQDVASVSSASSGLSLLASSAANQKYMDQAWDHVVSDIIKSSLSPKKVERVSTSSAVAAKPGDSFFEQFQKHLQEQQKQQQQASKAAGPTLDINQAKKMASLLIQNKALNPQQIQQKMKAPIQQGHSNSSAKPDSATKPTAPKTISKLELGASPALQTKQVPNVMSAKPKSGISLTSEEVYRRFLQESGNLPQKQLNLSSSQSVHKGISNSNQMHISQVQKSNSTKAHTPGQTSAQNLLLNTLSSNLSTQKIQGGHKGSLSMMDYSSTPGNALPRMKTPTQRTSPGSQMSRPVIGSQGQSSVKNDNSSSAVTAELMQQLFGKAESHSSGMHSYSKQPSPSSTHSYVKQPSPSGTVTKSVSPSGMQSKSISPSTIYSNKSVSPTAQGKAQNTVWSVASMTQGTSQKSSTSPFTQPHAPQVHKPLPGYQTLKMTNYPRETSPVSASTPVPLSPVQTRLPSPDILSPLGISPTSPLFPVTQNSMIHGHFSQTSPISQQAGRFAPYPTSPIHHHAQYSQYTDKQRPPHSYQ